MPCLLILVGVICPRLVLFIMWLTHFFATAHPWDTRIVPFLGWLFLPITTLCYGLCYVYNEGQFSIGWIIMMVISVLLDLGGNRSSTSKTG